MNTLISEISRFIAILTEIFFLYYFKVSFDEITKLINIS